MKNYFFRCTAIFILILSLGVSHSWAWDLANGRKIYFDMQNCTDFGTPYFRIGRDNWSAATAMTSVPGTKYLYLYTQSGKWENYGAFSVANGSGLTGGETIYQPYDGQSSNPSYTGDVIISKQLLFQKYDVTSDCYLQIKSANGDLSNGCQYYNVNDQTTDNGGSIVTLPTYSVTYNSSPSHGTVSVQKYTKTDGTTKAPLSTGDKVYPTQIIEITTTPDAHYTLASLTVTGATLIDGTTYYVTEDCEITATFDHQWTILGKNIYEEDAEKDKMGNWDVFNGLPFVSEHTHRGTITLDAHTAYNFKVHDRATSTWYGCGTRDNDYTYVGQTDAVEINFTNLSGHNVMLMTTKAGEYTFEWDEENKTLKILFPEDIVHPSMDYVYMEKYSDWNGGSYSYIHNWYTGTPDVALTDGGIDPKMTASFTSKSPAKTFYTYPVLTKYPHFKIAQGLNGGDGGVYHATSNMEVTDDHKGHYVYHNGSAWVWATFQVYIKLENQGADEGKKGTLGVPVAFNDTALSTKINKPIKSHYDFGGYYTAAEGGGVQIIDADGNWQTNVTDYTSSGKWIHAGDTTTLYAKWTEHPYDITLAVTPSAPENSSDSLQGGTITVNGEEATSVNAYYVTETAEIRAVPANDAYVFKEWRFSQTDSEYDVYVSDGEEYSSTSNPIKIKAQHTGTLTAVFQCRYGLVGSRYDNTPAGMPGWEYNTAADFAVIGFTSLGDGADKVVLKCDRTLGRATSYKFRIYDRVKDKAVGCGTKDAVLPAEYDPGHGIYNNWQLNLTDDGEDVNINTLGRGTYTFHITNISNDGNYWPSIQVDRQLSYQVHMGWKHAEAENLSSLSTGDDGGIVTVSVNEGGESAPVANDAWVAAGSTISFTASPVSSYYVAGWWSGDACTGDPFIGPNNLTPSWEVVGTVNAFVKFVEKNNTFEGDVEGYTTKWNQVGNWSEGHIPTIDEVAIVPKPVEVDIADAKAKRVLIKKDSPNTGKIDIPAGKELVVRATIKKTTDGSTYGATGYEDVVIGSSLAEGNGALVMGTNDGTNKATVYFATKAKKVDGHNVNQFIGTPFNDENDILYDYYGTKIYRFMAGHDGNLGPNHEWKRVAATGEKMNGFYGYNILTNQTTEPVMEMQGTLNRSAEETITGYYNGSSNTENMFANSWVAPIYIPNFEDGDFNNIEKTIYIFNAGTPADQNDHAMDAGDANTIDAGQYCVLPANSASYVGLTVIPSMQAFSVFATGPSPSLKFNYERLVYNPSTNGTAAIVPTRAPRRTEAEQTAPTVLKLKVSGESGYVANIVLLSRADFSGGFDDGWDGRFLPGDDAAPQLYAVTEDGNMAINCSPDIEGTLLGFKAGEADDLFTFTFEYDDEALYLYDTQTQLYTRVQTGNSYTFTTADGDAHNRFILTRKAPSIATGMEASNTPSPGANKVIIDTHLYIFRAGALYDALGRIIQ